MIRQKTNYFSHDANARNSAKLLRVRLKYGMEGYGTYFALIERLREENGFQAERDYDTIAFDLHVDTQIIQSIIEDFELFTFTRDGKHFYSKSLCERMNEMEEMTVRMREMGRRGGLKKAAKKQPGDEAATDTSSNAVARPLTKSVARPLTKTVALTNQLTNQPTNETNQQTNQPTSDCATKSSRKEGGRTNGTSLSAGDAGRGGGVARVGSIIQQAARQAAARQAAAQTGTAARQAGTAAREAGTQTGAAAQARTQAASPAAAKAGAAVPGPPPERNTRGLLSLLDKLGIRDEQDRQEILRLSNQGQIGHPVWRHLCDLRDGKFGDGIRMPGKFVLSKLKGDGGG